MNQSNKVSNKVCMTCGNKIVGIGVTIYYNNGIFCSDSCKNEDINRFNRRGKIESYLPPRTLMMSGVNGRNTEDSS
jgi:hypothetical protein